MVHDCDFIDLICENPVFVSVFNLGQFVGRLFTLILLRFQTSVISKILYGDFISKIGEAILADITKLVTTAIFHSIVNIKF